MDMTRMIMTMGACTFGAMVTVIGILLVTAIKNIIMFIRRKYKAKRRFNKPPLAKCYCIDCKWCNKVCDKNYCLSVVKEVADDFFCREASLR